MVARPVARLASHCACLLCGDENPFSLRLRFEEGESGGIVSAFQCHAGLQGYAGLVHGGVIAALLDAAMTHCLFQQGVEGVTADLQVRYLLPLPCEAQVRLAARIVETRAPLYRLAGEITTDGTLIARAKATFIDKARPALRRPRGQAGRPA